MKQAAPVSVKITLFYADDRLLFSQSCEEAEEMILMVVEVAGWLWLCECELCINKVKSSVLLYNCREAKPDEVSAWVRWNHEGSELY